jgi:hypothetical protein
MNLRRLILDCRGTSYSEVLIALAIVPISLLGAMGAFHAAEQFISQGAAGGRALALVESRIEAKRASRWEFLLVDDMNLDGRPDIVMHDDGLNGDEVGGDHCYTGIWESDGAKLTWTVAPNRGDVLAAAGYVVIEARAVFGSGGSRREIRAVTLRANPWFVGVQS